MCSDCEGEAGFYSLIVGAERVTGRRPWRWLCELRKGKARAAACSWRSGGPLGQGGASRDGLHRCGGVRVCEECRRTAASVVVVEGR